jgi:hypothetical protein
MAVNPFSVTGQDLKKKRGVDNKYKSSPFPGSADLSKTTTMPQTITSPTSIPNNAFNVAKNQSLPEKSPIDVTSFAQNIPKKLPAVVDSKSQLPEMISTPIGAGTGATQRALPEGGQSQQLFKSTTSTETAKITEPPISTEPPEMIVAKGAEVKTGADTAETKPVTQADRDIQAAMQAKRQLAKGISPEQQAIAREQIRDFDTRAALEVEAEAFRRGMTPGMTTGGKQALAAMEAASIRGERSGLMADIAKAAMEDQKEAINDLYNMAIGERAYQAGEAANSFDIQYQHMLNLLNDAESTGDYGEAQEQWNAMAATPEFAGMMPKTQYDWEGLKVAGKANRLKKLRTEVAAYIQTMPNTEAGKAQGYELSRESIVAVLAEEDPKWSSYTPEQQEEKAQNLYDQWWEFENESLNSRTVNQLMNEPWAKQYFDTPEERVQGIRLMSDVITQHGVTVDEDNNITVDPNTVVDVFTNPRNAHLFTKEKKEDGSIGYTRAGWNDDIYSARDRYVKKHKGDDAVLSLEDWETAYFKGLGEGKTPEEIEAIIEGMHSENTAKKENAYKDVQGIADIGRTFFTENNLAGYDENAEVFNDWYARLSSERKSENNLWLTTDEAVQEFNAFKNNPPDEYVRNIIATKNYAKLGDITSGAYKKALTITDAFSLSGDYKKVGTLDWKQVFLSKPPAKGAVIKIGDKLYEITSSVQTRNFGARRDYEYYTVKDVTTGETYEVKPTGLNSDEYGEGVITP